MVKPKPPCGKNCPRRSGECRIKCPDWIKYEAEINAFRAEKTKQIGNREQIELYTIEKIKKVRRKMQRKQ